MSRGLQTMCRATSIWALICLLSRFSLRANNAVSKSAQLSIISISLPPLQYYHEQQQLEGYFVEVIQAALATTDISYTMHLY